MSTSDQSGDFRIKDAKAIFMQYIERERQRRHDSDTPFEDEDLYNRAVALVERHLQPEDKELAQ